VADGFSARPILKELRMGLRDIAFAGTIVVGAAVLAGGVFRPSASDSPARRNQTAQPAPISDIDGTRVRVDAAFRDSWVRAGVQPTPAAGELTRMRRISLALTGSIPSLEEIRRFESEPVGKRLDPWFEELLRDRRTADYLSERLARALVGTEDGPFLIFRRRRFTTWLSDSILENRPYDQIVRDLIAENGLWTQQPATNFITVTTNPDTQRPDPEKLAVRVSRCFLGVRLDCAQCHDHPFRDWKQTDFRGIAAFFGGVHANLRGIRDEENDYCPTDPATNKPGKLMAPAVPFRPELLPAGENQRIRLVGWLTDPRNPNLARATVNRMWALFFGRPLSDPVDDLPADHELPEALKILATDFAQSGYDLRRLLRLIAESAPFLRDSASESAEGPSDLQEAVWASFPMTPLQPGQAAESVYQCSALSTIGPDSSWFVRLGAFTGRNDFVKRYGDLGEDEFDAPGGTIPQRLLLMNGDLVGEKIKSDLFTASSRIAAQAPDDRAAVEVAYLTILTRRPTPDETAYFAAKLAGTKGDERGERMTDLCWALLNCTEFSWNH
jgi:Protein of unknown function (DUF1549)/Protein of unknown function (DUF1553)